MLSHPFFHSGCPSPLVSLSDRRTDQVLPIPEGVSVWVKRDDLYCPAGLPLVQGNKWRKLRGNLRQAVQQQADAIVSFGGAHSNHLAALAAACAALKLKSVGVVRGEELACRPATWSPTLRRAQADGMQLVFVSREEYRQKTRGHTAQRVLPQWARPFLVPEGGSNALAVEGMAGLIKELTEQLRQLNQPPPTHVVIAVGTGGSMAGLVQGVQAAGWPTRVVGVPVLKGGKLLHRDIQAMLSPDCHVSWELWCDEHGGGYARLNDSLRNFARGFYRQYGFALDRVYTVKAFHAVFDRLQKGLFAPGSRVVLVHTGGMQGGYIQAE